MHTGSLCMLSMHYCNENFVLQGQLLVWLADLKASERSEMHHQENAY